MINASTFINGHRFGPKLSMEILLMLTHYTSNFPTLWLELLRCPTLCPTAPKLGGLSKTVLTVHLPLVIDAISHVS